MLLRQLLSHTWPEHPDYNTLTEAVLKMKGAADDVNVKKKQHEDSYSDNQTHLGSNLPDQAAPLCSLSITARPLGGWPFFGSVWHR